MVREGNVFVRWLLAQWGIPGFVVGKIAVFVFCFAISFYALRAWEDRVIYYFPPLLLGVFGMVLTGYNIYLLAV